MDYIEMVEKVREELLQEVNRRCDALIRNYQEEDKICFCFSNVSHSVKNVDSHCKFHS